MTKEISLKVRVRILVGILLLFLIYWISTWNFNFFSNTESYPITYLDDRRINSEKKVATLNHGELMKRSFGKGHYSIQYSGENSGLYVIIINMVYYHAHSNSESGFSLNIREKEEYAVDIFGEKIKIEAQEGIIEVNY